MYTESDSDHDLSLTRNNARTGKPYRVWVRFSSYVSDPSDCEAWTSMGCEVHLDREEHSTACSIYEQDAGRAIIDACRD